MPAGHGNSSQLDRLGYGVSRGSLLRSPTGAVFACLKHNRKQQRGGTNAVGAAAGDAGRGVAGKLGIEPGMVVQELGWDEDVDDDLRAAVEEQCGSELLDDDADEVVDLVLLWWREGDGDLVDALVDAIGPLAENGVVWVLTPKTGRPGHVEPSEIAEAAPTAGLSQTSNISVAEGWTGARLVAPRTAKSRR